jgi:hypothetical protein
MSELESVKAAADQTGQSDTALSSADLAKTVRGLKRWVIGLTIVVALMAIGGAATVSVAAWGIFAIPGAMMGTSMEPSAEAIEDTRSEIRSALGDRLDKLDVRAVTIDYGFGPPFPYSLMAGAGDSKSIYVEYRLKDSPTLIAGVLEGSPFGMDVASSGMLPTKGSLSSRMTDEQFERILKAYAVETRAPFGSVRRYGDRSAMMEGRAVPDKVRVGSQEYPSLELWSVTQGTLAKGDRISMDETHNFSGKSYVFHEDSKSGEFTCVGTEPAYGLSGP